MTSRLMAKHGLLGYAEQLNVSPHIEFFKAQSFERGADNRKYKAQGGTLLYSTWRDGMNVNE
ncbi:hypothetical protein [Staphylococcus pseudintermedius]|uniref:hypothetical protein n=1 Tax=Staphylococcus pseudintermedius TaxID=283734 RepID=UPI001F5BC6A7